MLAVAVCRDEGPDGARVLVERGRDAVRAQDYYRAIGGGVEFGERAVDAVCREWREELALTLADVTPLGVLENLFTYEGRPGHEIVLVFAARLVERWPHERSAFAATDADGLRHEAVWVCLDALDRPGELPLYPEGLVALLGGAARAAGRATREGRTGVT